ncbi:MAG TPA: hypothetical protein VHL77_05475, partial [Ferruginibacter sp.]|nr:hypothetical protein [Ferruginibacter sp.]
MKLKLIHILSLLAVTILLSACFGDADPKIPSLAETYSKKDKRPFGTDIAFRQLEAMYPSQVIREKKLDFKKTWQGISDTGALYVCIAQKLFVDDDEAEAMMDFVHAGNSLFISATVIDDILLDKIGSNMVSTDPMMERALGIMLQTGVHAAAEPGSAYAYYYYPFQNYFITVDSSNTRVLGYNDMHKPNLIVHFYGRGK